MNSRLLLLGPFIGLLLLGSCSSNNRPLQLVKGADAAYPQQARRQGIEGYVTLSYSVSAAGQVSNVEVVEAQPPGVFDAVAIATVQRWRYNAPVQQGQSVAVPRVISTLRFEMADHGAADKYDGY